MYDIVQRNKSTTPELIRECAIRAEAKYLIVGKTDSTPNIDDRSDQPGREEIIEALIEAPPECMMVIV